LPHKGFIRAYRSPNPNEILPNELNIVLSYEDEQQRPWDFSFDWHNTVRGVQRAIHVPSFIEPKHVTQGDWKLTDEVAAL
jgi:hypothetical protein